MLALFVRGRHSAMPAIGRIGYEAVRCVTSCVQWPVQFQQRRASASLATSEQHHQPSQCVRASVYRWMDGWSGKYRSFIDLTHLHGRSDKSIASWQHRGGRWQRRVGITWTGHHVRSVINSFLSIIKTDSLGQISSSVALSSLLKAVWHPLPPALRFTSSHVANYTFFLGDIRGVICLSDLLKVFCKECENMSFKEQLNVIQRMSRTNINVET